MKIANLILVSFLSFLLLFNSFKITTGMETTGNTTIDKIRLGPSAAVSEQNNFDLQINFVGTSGFEEDKILPVYNNVYEIILQKGDSVSIPIIIKYNVTGWTSFNFGNQSIAPELDTNYPNRTILDLGINTITTGQIFSILDDDISMVQPLTTQGTFGYSTIVSLGDHVLTLIYVGSDGNEYFYDSESIIIRVLSPNENYSELKTREIPVSLDFTEIFEPNVYTDNIIGWQSAKTNSSFTVASRVVSEFLNYFRIENFAPEINYSLSINGEELNDFATIAMEEDEISELEPGTITLTGRANTTGIAGLQFSESWDTKSGLVFLRDFAGIHPIESITKITLNEGFNYFGVIGLSPYGVLHEALPCLSLCDTIGFADWEDRIPGKSIYPDYNSSFDFMASFDAIELQFFVTANQETVTEEASSISFIGLLAPMMLVTISRFYKRKTGKIDFEK